MLGRKEEGHGWGRRKEQERDSEAVLCHAHFCPPGPGTHDDRGGRPEDVTWGALLNPLSMTQSDPSFVTRVPLPAFRGLFHVPLIR